jgi:hypothetical protein
MKKNMQNKAIDNYFFVNTTQAVSEVIGVVLILAIVIGAMTGVYLMVFNPLTSSNTLSPAVELVATINQEGTQIFFEHRGGPPLSKNLDITVNLADISYSMSPGDENLTLDSNYWSFGQRMVYIVPQSIGSLYGLYVHVRIFDLETNSVLLDSIIQDGDKVMYPIIKLNSPKVLYNKAWLNISWATRDHDGSVNFFCEYRRKGGNGQPPGATVETEKITKDSSNQQGLHDFLIEDLTNNTWYQYRGVVTFEIGGVILRRETEWDDFETGGFILGHWRFTFTGANFLLDSSVYNNHGELIKQVSEYDAGEGVPPPVGALNNTGVSTGLMLYGMSQYMSVSSSGEQNSLNTDSQNLSIEAWVQRKINDSYGSFDNPSIIESSNFDMLDMPSFLANSDFIHVHDTYYAMVFSETTNIKNGWVVTVEIDDNGVINYIDKYEFRSSHTLDPRIIHVYNDTGFTVFAVVYTTTINDKGGQITTLAINNDGSIHKTFPSLNMQLETSNVFFKDPDILKIKEGASSSLFAVVYGTNQNGDAYKQKIQTLNISYTNGIQLKSSKLFCQRASGDYGDNIGEGPVLFFVKENVYACIYNNAESPNRPNAGITTFTIDNVSGNIVTKNEKITFILGIFNPKVLRVVEKDDGQKVYFTVIHQFYESSPNTNIQKIYSLPIWISFDGNVISDEEDYIKSDEIAPVSSETFRFNPKVIELSQDDDEVIFAIVFSDISDNGRITTLNISKEDMTQAIINEEITGSPSEAIHRRFAYSCNYPNVLAVKNYGDNTLLAISYRSRWNFHAHVKTINISNTGVLPRNYANYIRIPTIDDLYLGKLSWIYPDMIHITGQYYGIVSRDYDMNGIVRIVSIDQDGEFNDNAVIDSLQFDVFVDYPRLVKISEDDDFSYLAAIYRGNQSKMTIATMKMDKNTGQVTSIIDPIPLTPTICTGYSDSAAGRKSHLNIIHVRDVSSTHQTYAVVYNDASEVIHLCVVNITNDGTNAQLITTNMVHQSNSDTPHMTSDIAHVRDNLFAITYTTYTATRKQDLYLQTVTIQENGNINMLVSQKIYDAANSHHRGIYNPTLIAIEEKGVAVSFSYNSWSNPNSGIYGKIETYLVNADGSFDFKDGYEFNKVASGHHSGLDTNPNQYNRAPTLFHIRNDAYGLIYRGNNPGNSDKGRLQIIRINGTTGRITDTSIRDMQFEDPHIRYPYSKPLLINQDDERTIIGLAYPGGDYSLYAQVKTIQIPNKDLPLQQLVAKGDLTSNTGYGLFINATHVVGRINDKTISAELENDLWNYIVLTKTPSNITLYINAGEPTTLEGYTDPIDISDEPVIFGKYIPVLMDEVKIRVTSMTKQEVQEEYEKYTFP